MFDREEFYKIRNIVSLNNNQDIDVVYDVMTSLSLDEKYRACSHLIKNATDLQSLDKNFDVLVKSIERQDKITFYTTMLDIIGNDIDDNLLINVLKVIKDDPSLEKDIYDSFSTNQMSAKTALLDAVDNLNILDKSSIVVIWGVWYGSILIPKLANKVKKIIGIDIDERPLYISKNRIFPNYENIEYICDDVFETYRDAYLNTKLIINTSCEHMKPMKDWPWFRFSSMATDAVHPKGYADDKPHRRKVYQSAKLSSDCYFAFQSNNMFDIEGHINCVSSLEEFKQQLPERAEVLYENEVADTRDTRYMLVGKFNHLV